MELHATVLGRTPHPAAVGSVGIPRPKPPCGLHRSLARQPTVSLLRPLEPQNTLPTCESERNPLSKKASGAATTYQLLTPVSIPKHRAFESPKPSIACGPSNSYPPPVQASAQKHIAKPIETEEPARWATPPARCWTILSRGRIVRCPSFYPPPRRHEVADRCLSARAVDRDEVDRLRKRFMKLDKVRYARNYGEGLEE
jgi:hypothetical protein